MFGLPRTQASRPLALRFGLVLMAGLLHGPAAWAQTTTPQSPAAAAPPAASTPAAPAPPAVTSPSPSGTPTTPAPAAPAEAAKPPAPDSTGASVGDASISQALDVQPRPAVVINGSATWDDGFKTLTDAFAKLNDALAKNNMTSAGRPLAVFTATDDAGFKYSAMVPIAKAPEGKTELTPDIKISETPSGKAIRFQHRAAYDDIDSTYEAITAYLDEKGLEARNLFAEEYLNMTKTPDDPALEVDIYVFLK
ncbi:GyrI-like domain-containing protein [Lichenifustis flavocetrariae]|uniref:GyrI-like domain-containing protein n=1 Tax=Lichenifustis flavocetrariae TaxID=2949735 RepID=A0AA41YVI2_9HYPH|nr:GyrI-like domain-containing protein [Lichenifustis flavocetrariae]MCW6507693.1 GyrI-like domain-containing protein [Lichenifustis flavocetrariae]